MLIMFVYVFWIIGRREYRNNDIIMVFVLSFMISIKMVSIVSVGIVWIIFVMVNIQVDKW